MSVHLEIVTKHFVMIQDDTGEIDLDGNAEQTLYFLRPGLWGEISNNLYFNKFIGFSVFGRYYYKKGIDWIDIGVEILFTM